MQPNTGKQGKLSTGSLSARRVHHASLSRSMAYVEDQVQQGCFGTAKKFPTKLNDFQSVSKKPMLSWCRKKLEPHDEHQRHRPLVLLRATKRRKIMGKPVIPL